jgi:hypothetical protein
MPQNSLKKTEMALNLSFIFIKKSFTNPSKLLSDYVRRFATEEALRETEKKEDSSDSELSEFSDDETKDMEL